MRQLSAPQSSDLRRTTTVLPLLQMVNVTAPGPFTYPRLSEGNYPCLMCMARATPIVLALPGHFFHSRIDIEAPRLFGSFHPFLLHGLYNFFHVG